MLPGFRRGRAPRRLLEKRFSTSIQQDVKGQLISEAYSQAIEEESIEVIGEPEVKDVEELELPDSGDLEFVVEVEVSPEVTLPDLSKIELTKSDTSVTDQDVDEEIDRLRERFGTTKSVEDGKIKAGDYVQANVKILPGEDAADDTEPIAEHPGAYILVHGKEHDHRGHVAGILVDDLGKRLTGKTVGDSEAISLTGPSGHENEQIKDQPITIAISITQIERPEPAKVEDLLERIGAESEEDLKKQVRENSEQRAEREQQADLRQQLCDTLVEKVDLELPEGLTGRQAARVLQRQQMEMMYRGAAPQEIEEKLAEMRSGSEEEARRQLKLFFIVDRAAKEQEVEVAEGEINSQIAMIAMQQGRRPEKLRQEMLKRGELEQLYLQVREQKTLDRLLEQVKVKQVKGGDKGEAKAETKKKTTKKKTTKKKTTKKKD